MVERESVYYEGGKVMNPTHKSFEISGHIYTPDGVTTEEFFDKFIGFVEDSGWTFRGGIRPEEESK